jgi:peptide/nickel transport system substrate-binding protein
MKKALLIIFAFTLLIPSLALGQDILKIGFQEDIKTLNYFKAKDIWSHKVLDNIYESLYVYSPETYKITPWLAEGQPKIDKENLTADVRIRSGIKWSDGTDFTVDDVIFTAQIFIDYDIPGLDSFWEFVESIEKLDENTVRYHLTELRATFIHGTMMLFIKPTHIWKPIIESAVAGKSGKSATASILNINPTESQTIGTGPYILKEWNRNQFISLTENPDYHMKGKRIQGNVKQYRIGPYVNGILYRIFRSNDNALEALKKEDIDYISWEILPEMIPTLEDEAGINLIENEENSMYYLAFNLRKAPFRNKGFRQAMAWLIDRNYIRDKILKGYGDAMVSIVPEGNASFHNSNVLDYGTIEELTRKRREEIARDILQNSGFSWDEDGNLLDSRGNTLNPIQILTPTADYDPIRSICGFIISEWWSAVGVPVTSRPVSFGELLDRTFTERDFDVFILGWSLDVFPSYLRDFFHSTQDEPNGNNPTGYKDIEYDKASTEFINETDIADQIAKARELQSIIAEECVYIPLYTKRIIEAYSTRFEGWISQLNGIGNFWSMLMVKPAG